MTAAGPLGRQSSFARRVRLAAEVVLLFYGLPLAYVLGVRPRFVLALLWVAAAVAGWVLWRDRTFDRHWLIRTQGLGRATREMLPLFAVAFIVAAAGVWAWSPDALFALPRERPAFWLILVTLYPLLSVYPQELVWRAFFFHRYRPLFGSLSATVWASALAFAWVHVVMLNAFAVMATLVGGLIFARRYAKTASLPTVSVEHSLYGLLAFTVGLGAYFFHGTYRGAP